LPSYLSPRVRARALAAAIVVVGLLTAAGQAHAALGGARASVEADRAHMAARMQATYLATHTVQTLTASNGDTIREFVAVDGTVFALAWTGPARPDLKQLLGDRFTVVQADNDGDAQAGHRRRPLGVNRGDFILRTGGHPGAFWGVAYLPGSIPTGVRLEDLQ
jgi:hypothetical protein